MGSLCSQSIRHRRLLDWRWTLSSCAQSTGLFSIGTSVPQTRTSVGSLNGHCRPVGSLCSRSIRHRRLLDWRWTLSSCAQSTGIDWHFGPTDTDVCWVPQRTLSSGGLPLFPLHQTSSSLGLALDIVVLRTEHGVRLALRSHRHGRLLGPSTDIVVRSAPSAPAPSDIVVSWTGVGHCCPAHRARGSSRLALWFHRHGRLLGPSTDIVIRWAPSVPAPSDIVVSWTGVEHCRPTHRARGSSRLALRSHRHGHLLGPSTDIVVRSAPSAPAPSDIVVSWTGVGHCRPAHRARGSLPLRARSQGNNQGANR